MTETRLNVVGAHPKQPPGTPIIALCNVQTLIGTERD